ncbi:MAG: GHKL domain-containing protein [Oligoflexia bacterium]|nr:GHKL domain-containing protein [Oligoflexia bacterium]
MKIKQLPLSSYKVKIYLFTSVILLSFIPMVATYLFLDEILDSTLNFKLHKDTIPLLKESQQDLKLLRDLRPEKHLGYRDRFYQISNEINLLDSFDVNKSALKRSFLTYFSIGAAITIAIALCLTLYFSMKISRSYKRLLNENLNQNKRLSTLEHLRELKEVARMLAHEIKNPLTPIEMMVRNLLQNSNSNPNSNPNSDLNIKETSKIIMEELSKLKKMLHSFSSFSKLPNSELQNINLADYLNEFIKNYQSVWEDVNLKLENICTEAETSSIAVQLDPSIFRQVLINLINNAQEANKTKIDVSIKINVSKDYPDDIPRAEIFVLNNGKSISPSEREKIFRIHYSTKKESGHMGLGLKIIQTIILEHNGEIRCLPIDNDNGAGFLITLPTLSKQEHNQCKNLQS